MTSTDDIMMHAAARLGKCIGLLVINVLLHCTAELREYCFPNSFNVTCQRDEVIVMTSARYGRMSRGQCLTSDYQIGCWADVLQPVDRRCSGRRQCVFPIPDTILHNLHPCQKDLLAYLESEHVCQKVQTRPIFPPCQHVGVIQLQAHDSAQFLASSVTHDHGFGSARCPWLLAAPRGRRINVTLLDFGLAARHPSPDNSLAGSPTIDLCHVYARIRELPAGAGTSDATALDAFAGAGQEVTVCAGRSRERTVYISESERIEVTLITGSKSTSDPAYFLLQFNAIGCADPVTPRSAWLRRDGNKATVTCNFTTQTWHIVCQHDEWFGTVENCTVETLMAKSSTLSAETELEGMLPIGVLIAIMFGLLLGVIMGVILLAVVMSCHKRFQRLKAPPEVCAMYDDYRRDDVAVSTAGDQYVYRCAEHQAMCARYTHVCAGATNIGPEVRYQSDSSPDQMSPL